MNAPVSQKYFGERVPPTSFWVLLGLLVLAFVAGANKWWLAAIMGLAIGVYVVWSRKHDDGRRITYPETVLRKAGMRRRH